MVTRLGELEQDNYITSSLDIHGFSFLISLRGPGLATTVTFIPVWGKSVFNRSAIGFKQTCLHCSSVPVCGKLGPEYHDCSNSSAFVKVSEKLRFRISVDGKYNCVFKFLRSNVDRASSEVFLKKGSTQTRLNSSTHENSDHWEFLLSLFQTRQYIQHHCAEGHSLGPVCSSTLSILHGD